MLLLNRRAIMPEVTSEKLTGRERTCVEDFQVHKFTAA
jgi:hypothetical protein